MDPLTLITTAVTIATPYLIKSGEKFAEKVGEDAWKWIKESFADEKQKSAIENIEVEPNAEKLKNILLDRANTDNEFKEGLEAIVSKAQKDLNAYYQQNINNEGNIEKQINIQENTGNIQM